MKEAIFISRLFKVMTLRLNEPLTIHYDKASSKSENHKKSTADIKKYTIPLVSLSIITISNHSNTQALGKKLYLVKINAS